MKVDYKTKYANLKWVQASFCIIAIASMLFLSPVAGRAGMKSSAPDPGGDRGTATTPEPDNNRPGVSRMDPCEGPGSDPCKDRDADPDTDAGRDRAPDPGRGAGPGSGGGSVARPVGAGGASGN